MAPSTSRTRVLHIHNSQLGVKPAGLDFFFYFSYVMYVFEVNFSSSLPLNGVIGNMGCTEPAQARVSPSAARC
jgi:hypothetical protein